MQNAKISELKNHLSRFLAYVRRGGRVRVFDRDTPVADLVPCETPELQDPDDNARLAALERAGCLRRGTAGLPEDLCDRTLPEADRSVLEALLDEREGGR